MNASRLLYLQGCLLVLLAGTLWSFGGLILRHVREADEWQFLFYRSVGLALVLLLQFRLQRAGSVLGRYRESGGVGIAATLCVAVSAVSFIYSLTHTSVANSLLLTSVSPLLTVALGYWVLGERLDRRTALALLLALAGIAVMVRGDLGRGQWFGNVMALTSALAFAGYSVCLRLGRERDMLPAVLVYALLTALV
ncbi:MAG TPA: DMT family transporter, partial [Roseiflexaceae bacterium]|nr:DMT family transporter [Roseiflexaceae bacterium]